MPPRIKHRAQLLGCAYFLKWTDITLSFRPPVFVPGCQWVESRVSLVKDAVEGEKKSFSYTAT